ncbi:MAG: translation initiation factor IF-2 [Candidatus Omnitrophica bacterium]|nr:translation initiation factor IF-2 [Candidatus Omnitrophota bacterium]
MKVSDLAKEYNTTSKAILDTLKSLKLKAKDADQELNIVVVSVLRSNFKGREDLPKPPSLFAEKKMIEDSKPPVIEVEESVPAEEPKPTTSEEKTPKEKKGRAKKAPSSKEKKESSDEEKENPPVKEEAAPRDMIIRKEEVARREEIIRKEKIAREEEAIRKEEVIRKEEAAKKVEAADAEKLKIKKAKIKISKEPLITLKPLQRKKKPGSRERDAGEELHPATVSGLETVSEGLMPGALESAQAPSAPMQEIEINLPITVKDLSQKIQQKPSAVLTELMKMGLLAHINQSLDETIVTKLTHVFGFNFAKIKTQEEQLIEVHKNEQEDPKLLKPRSPVITFMGHVDHGKTSLIDRIRRSKVVDTEHGGITQHMHSYSVEHGKGRITFLDTPGHEAFTAMRARGAHITDIVVLVVAADEGVMPQTEEAIDHARAAGVPIVVALNKIDKRNADIDRVKKQLSERDLMAEDWGGKTIVAPVSATTGEGIDNLLEMLLLESEVLELKANPDKKASGIVVEAHLSQGKGVVATLIVQSGTLKEGDFVVTGPFYGKLKAMLNDYGKPIKEAGPSMPVEVIGISHVPEAGEIFYVVDGEKQARDICLKRQDQLKNEKIRSMTRVTLEDLQAQIMEGAVKELNVVLKADVQGSAEALRDSLAKIPSDKVKINFIHSGVGEVNTSDVVLAKASRAIIIAFHVGVDVRAQEELKKDPVDIREYRIIYDAVDDMRKALEGLLEAKTKKIFLARVEVRQVFKLSKHGIIAGCYVLKGKVTRKAKVDVVRNGEIVHSGSLSSLKRFKDDVREVTENMECGISVSGFDQYAVGDTIEVYDIERVAQKL